MEPPRHSMRVAILAAWTNLRTPCYRVPGCIRPLNRRLLGHIYLIKIRILFVGLNISLFLSKILNPIYVYCTVRVDIAADFYHPIES
jgi:hypothetical protein